MKSPILLLFTTILLAACSATNTATQPSELGTAASMTDILKVIEQPGPIDFKKHVAANWQVPLSGLLNLKHPKVIAAGIEDREEKIQVFVYSLTHPKYGTFIVDSGISTRFENEDGNSDISFIVEKAMNMSALEVLLNTKNLSERLGGIAGVLLTHIHMDHIMGLSDLDSNVPVYIGPGDATLTTATHIATQGTTNRLLNNVTAFREWQFGDDGVVDVFGDGSLWAIHSPGHTPGSIAYLARTTNGPQLMIGDATHTRWGWDNGVEPGTYSEDGPLSVISLGRLRALADKHSEITVHPGHQN